MQQQPGPEAWPGPEALQPGTGSLALKPGLAWPGPEAQQQQAWQKPTPVDTPTYLLVLERRRRRFEERALLVPEVEEVILTNIKQSVQGFSFPATDRHPGPTPWPDTQAQHPGTGQQQQTWLKHNTMQAD